MSDFIVALGLVLVIEGVLFAALPLAAKHSIARVLETPDASLRVVGIASAVFGLALVWFIRG